MDQEVAVVIPCYRVSRQIGDVLARIGDIVSRIYVVDDCCPEASGVFVQKHFSDPRITVLFNDTNLGVGGAVKRGFYQAALDGYTYLVKLDGDGQMDPEDIPRLIQPLRDGQADYVKANRFFNPRALKGMPAVRIFGNGVLSFLTKLSSGYWQVMDPTNGFLAVHSSVFLLLEHEKIDNRFFFETDMLCRLHLHDAVVQDVPIPARYGDERSNLKIGAATFTFLGKHISRIFRRLVYDYFVRDFNVGSAQLVTGLFGFLFGSVFGLYHWWRGVQLGAVTETGTIMIAILPMILGFQLLLSALHYDISVRNVNPVHKYYRRQPEGALRSQQRNESASMEQKVAGI